MIVKERKRGNTKSLSPCRRNRMLCSLNYRQDIIVHENTNLQSSLLSFKELNMGYGDLSTNFEYDNRSYINFQLHHALNQVDLNIYLLDEVILSEVVLRPNKKTQSLGPHKSILKNGNKKKSRLGNKKFRSVSKPLYGINADHNSNNGLNSTTTSVTQKQRQEQIST